MKIGAIIQARLSSTRFPKKIIYELPVGSGITVLTQVIRRVKKAKMISSVIVATTDDKNGELISKTIKSEKVKIFKGDEENVLSRFYKAAKFYKLDIIVRVTSDCPCIDPKVIDKVIKQHLKTKSDYTSNTLQRTFPRGLDVEVFSFEALEKANAKALAPSEKEHVTPYIYNPANSFKISSYVKKGINLSSLRLTLDETKDYFLLGLVYEFLYKKNNFFALNDIEKIFERHSWLKLINEDVVQKPL